MSKCCTYLICVSTHIEVVHIAIAIVCIPVPLPAWERKSVSDSSEASLPPHKIARHLTQTADAVPRDRMCFHSEMYECTMPRRLAREMSLAERTALATTAIATPSLRSRTEKIKSMEPSSSNHFSTTKGHCKHVCSGKPPTPFVVTRLRQHGSSHILKVS